MFVMCGMCFESNYVSGYIWNYASKATTSEYPDSPWHTTVPGMKKEPLGSSNPQWHTFVHIIARRP